MRYLTFTLIQDLQLYTDPRFIIFRLCRRRILVRTYSFTQSHFTCAATRLRFRVSFFADNEILYDASTSARRGKKELALSSNSDASAGLTSSYIPARRIPKQLLSVPPFVKYCRQMVNPSKVRPCLQ